MHLQTSEHRKLPSCHQHRRLYTTLKNQYYELKAIYERDGNAYHFQKTAFYIVNIIEKLKQIKSPFEHDAQIQLKYQETCTWAMRETLDTRSANEILAWYYSCKNTLNIQRQNSVVNWDQYVKPLEAANNFSQILESFPKFLAVLPDSQEEVRFEIINDIYNHLFELRNSYYELLHHFPTSHFDLVSHIDNLIIILSFYLYRNNTLGYLAGLLTAYFRLETEHTSTLSVEIHELACRIRASKLSNDTNINVHLRKIYAKTKIDLFQKLQSIEEAYRTPHEFFNVTSSHRKLHILNASIETTFLPINEVIQPLYRACNPDEINHLLSHLYLKIIVFAQYRETKIHLFENIQQAVAKLTHLKAHPTCFKQSTDELLVLTKEYLHTGVEATERKDYLKNKIQSCIEKAFQPKATTTNNTHCTPHKSSNSFFKEWVSSFSDDSDSEAEEASYCHDGSSNSANQQKTKLSFSGIRRSI